MKFYNFLIRYRFWLGLVALTLAITVNFTSGFWPAFILYFVALIALFSHFFVGPLRLVQGPMERGDVEAVKKILNSVWFPNLLYKPIRSTYFALQGNLAMMSKNFDDAEANLKKSSSLGSPMPEAAGANNLQLGMLALQKGDFRQGEAYLREALRNGLTDNESRAVAYLSMSQIFIRKGHNRAGKDFFKKAVACKPKTEEVVQQINEMKKHISRMPG